MYIKVPYNKKFSNENPKVYFLSTNKNYFDICSFYVMGECSFQTLIILNNTEISYEYYLNDYEIKIFSCDPKNVILSNVLYNPYKINTINKFNPSYDSCKLYLPHYIELLCKLGEVKVLEWLKNSELYLIYGYNAMYVASLESQINVLEWWKHSGLPLKYCENTIDMLSLKGHIDILEWWKNSGLSLKYSNWGVDSASKYGHINVLEWWKNSGLPLKYSDYAMVSTFKINVLEWWKNSGLPLKYSEIAMDYSSIQGYIHILDWWKNSGLPLKYSEIALDNASKNRHINVLEWWKKSGLELKYSSKCIIDVIKSKYIPILDIPVLEWWKDSGLPIKFRNTGVDVYEYQMTKRWLKTHPHIDIQIMCCDD
jgi:hypothetical protein